MQPTVQTSPFDLFHFNRSVSQPRETINFSQSLLRPGEQLRVLSIQQQAELKDYLYLLEKNYPSKACWESIRSNWVTNQMTTIWQLSVRYFHKHTDAIGNEPPPYDLIHWILDESPREKAL